MTNETQTSSQSNQWQIKLSNLLKLIGNAGECKGCNALIYWVTTKTKKAMPLDPDGVPHWSTCPKAREFRKAAR